MFTLQSFIFVLFLMSDPGAQTENIICTLELKALGNACAGNGKECYEIRWEGIVKSFDSRRWLYRTRNGTHGNPLWDNTEEQIIDIFEPYMNGGALGERLHPFFKKLYDAQNASQVIEILNLDPSKVEVNFEESTAEYDKKIIIAKKVIETVEGTGVVGEGHSEPKGQDEVTNTELLDDMKDELANAEKNLIGTVNNLETQIMVLDAKFQRAGMALLSLLVGCILLLTGLYWISRPRELPDTVQNLPNTIGDIPAQLKQEIYSSHKAQLSGPAGVFKSLTKKVVGDKGQAYAHAVIPLVILYWSRQVTRIFMIMTDQDKSRHESNNEAKRLYIETVDALLPISKTDPKKTSINMENFSEKMADLLCQFLESVAPQVTETSPAPKPSPQSLEEIENKLEKLIQSITQLSTRQGGSSQDLAENGEKFESWIRELKQHSPSQGVSSQNLEEINIKLDSLLEQFDKPSPNQGLSSQRLEKIDIKLQSFNRQLESFSSSQSVFPQSIADNFRREFKPRFDEIVRHLTELSRNRDAQSISSVMNGVVSNLATKEEFIQSSEQQEANLMRALSNHLEDKLKALLRDLLSDIIRPELDLNEKMKPLLLETQNQLKTYIELLHNAMKNSQNEVIDHQRTSFSQIESKLETQLTLRGNGIVASLKKDSNQRDAALREHLEQRLPEILEKKTGKEVLIEAIADTRIWRLRDELGADPDRLGEIENSAVFRVALQSEHWYQALKAAHMALKARSNLANRFSNHVLELCHLEVLCYRAFDKQYLERLAVAAFRKDLKGFLELWSPRIEGISFSLLPTVAYITNNMLCAIHQDDFDHPVHTIGQILDEIFAAVAAAAHEVGIRFHRIPQHADFMRCQFYMRKSSEISVIIREIIQNRPEFLPHFHDWVESSVRAMDSGNRDLVVDIVDLGYDVADKPGLGKKTLVTTFQDIRETYQLPAARV